ncbi:hypothetical protein SARC_00810 [Sphaeroforma arctica JP610]|uniref:1-phosphatidylinositol-3-phosphate 5-kinase n=1 Tax=Sphaeroforma arctica JP610 TaxID=667725 RepID=A0A0L0GDX3_9EUKA|nr:hypothetical protein SARC_00810 [Sphaeroforma arctica JP610]KNC87066.1 hypothetical protein SARC_00810 [Sphaeroforma arctica JP610]|eukprot:XP_014160968.1 hypothetical protein SARC_00810 [Sphaeroforma arctica JP610]
MSTRQYGRQQSLGLVTFGNPPTGEREEHTPRSTLSRMFSGWMTPNISRTPHDVIGSPTADAAHLFVHKKSSNLSRLSSRSSTATPDTPKENEGKSFKRQVSKSRSLNSVRESHTHAEILPHNEPRTSDWVKQRILSLGDILATRDDESDHSIYWAPDDQCRSCYQCGAQFTTFRRRHHCRICGQIYCWNCCHSRVDCSTVGIDEVMRLCVFCEKIVNDSSASIKETEVDDGRGSASSVDQLPTSTFLSKSVLPPTRFDSDREVASTAHLFIPPSFTGSARRAAKLKAEALNEEKKNVVSKPVELDIIISSPKLNTRASASADGISVALPQKSDTGSGGVDENEKEKAGVADQSVGVNEDSTGMHKALLDDGSVKGLKSEPMTVINFDMGSGKQTPVKQTASTLADSIDASHIPDDGVDLKGISVIMMKNIIAHALAIPGKFKLGDRRFRLKTYSNCFVASDFIDWLLLGEYVSDRDAAIELGERMVSHDLIKSAADHENSFRDDYLLFRFTDTATAKPPIATRYSIANLVPRPCMPNFGKEPSVSDGIYYQPAVPNLQRGKDTLDMSLAKHRVKRSNSFFANLPGVDVVRSSSLDPGILASLSSLSSGDLDTARFKPGVLSDMKQQFGGTSVATDLSRSKSSAFKPMGGGHSISVIKPIPYVKEEESVIGSTTSKLPDAHEQSESAVDRLVESHTNRHSRTISRNAEADILLHNSSGEPLKLGQNPRLRGKEFKSKLSNQVPVQPSTGISLREQKKTEDQYIRFISDAVRQRRLRMCSQILCDMGLSVSWVSTVESLAQEAVVQVRTPALGSADPMDIRQWIKTKIIPYGAKSDSQCIHGVVCAQHLVHKKMRTDITNPRILLLNSSIEYDQTHAITSMEDVFKKDQLLKSLQLQIDLIKCHRPDVVLVSGSVAYKAQEMFLAENISLAVNVKRSTLDFVKRCTGAEIQESMAEMRVSKTSIVGTCGRFFIGTVTAGKPLMYFTECNPRRGVTITLRGADEATLKKVKQALSFITFVSYCGFIESFYLSDVFAVIPEDERDKETIACNITDNPKKSHRDRFCSLANQSVLSTSPMVDFDIPYLYSSKGKAMLSYFPSGLYTTRRLQASNYQTLPIDLRTAYLLKQHPAEREPKKHLLSNPLPKPFDAVRTDWDSRSKYHPGKDIHFAMLHDERQPMETQAASDANGEESQFSNRKLASWDALNPAMHQSIQVLYSVELPGNGEQPARMCLKPKKMDFYYYGDKDQSLGSFLSRYCFNTHACPSETCDRPLSEHKRIFSHQDARISFINIPSNVIRGQEQTLLMWSICHECMKYGPCIPVSEETWCMSFGKFLELSFHEKTLGCRVTQITNESGMMKLVEDKHSFHRNHNRYYGLNDQAVVVQYDKIDMLLEVVVPPTIVTSKPVPLKCGEFLSAVVQLQKEMQMLFESLSLQLACLYVRARESGSQTFASHAHKLLRRSFIEASLYGSRVDQIARHAHAKHIHGQSHTESELGGTTDDFDDEDEESLRSALPEGTYVSDSSRQSSALQEGDHVDSDVSSLNVSRMSFVVSTNVSATVSSVPVQYVAPEENTTTMTTVSVHEEDDDSGLDQPAVEGWEGAVLTGSNASSRGIPDTVSGVEVAAIDTNRTNEYDTPRDAEVGEGISNMLPCVREIVADNVTDTSADSLPAIPSKEMTSLAENSDLQCSRSKSISRDSMTQVIPLSAGDQIGKDTINEIIKAHQLDTSTISDITGRPFREGPPSLTPDLIEDKGDSEASAHGAKVRVHSKAIEVALPNGEKENENVRDQLSPPPEVGGDNPALQRDLILAKEHTEAMERSKKYIQMRKASQVSDGGIPMQTYHRFASLANAPTTVIRIPTESDHPAVPDAAELDSPGVRAGEDEDVSLSPNAEEVSGPLIVQTSPEEDDDARDRSYSRELPPPLPDCEFTSNGRYPSARLNKPAPPQTDIPRDPAETQEDCVRELPPPLPASPSESEEEELLRMEPPSFLSVDIQNYDDAQFEGDEKTLPASEVTSGDGAEEMLSDDSYQIPVSETRLPGSLLRLEPIKPEMRRSISAASSAALALEKFERSSMSLRARAEESNNAKNKMQPCGSAPLPRRLTARSSSLYLPLQGTQDEDTGDPLNGTQDEGTDDFGEFSSYKFTSIKPSPTPERKMSANSILAKAKANLKPLTGFAELLDESLHPMGFVSSSTQAPSAGLSLALDDRTAQPLIRHATFPRMMSLTLGQGSDSIGYHSPGMLAEDAAAGVPLPPAVDLLDDEAIFGEPMVTGPPAMNVVDDAGASVNQISTESSSDMPAVAGSPLLGTKKPIDSTQSAKPISSAAVRFLESGEKASVVADDKGENPPLEILPGDYATSPATSTAPPSPVQERADTLESEAAYIEAKSVVSDSASKPTPSSIENDSTIPKIEGIAGSASALAVKRIAKSGSVSGNGVLSGMFSPALSLSGYLEHQSSRASMTDRTAPGSPVSVRSVPTQSCIVDGESESAESTMSADPLTIHSDLESYKSADVESNDVDFQEAGVSDSESLQNPSDVVKATIMIGDVPIILFNTRRLSKKVSLADLRGEEIFNPDATVTDDESPRTIDTISEKEDDHDDESYMLTAHTQGRRSTDVLMHAGSADRLIFAKKSQLNRDSSNLRSKASSVSQTHQPFQPTKVLRRHSLCEKNPCEECESDRVSNQDVYLPNTEATASKVNDDKMTLQMGSSTGANATSKVSKIQSQRKLSDDILSDIDIANKDTKLPSTVVDTLPSTSSHVNTQREDAGLESTILKSITEVSDATSARISDQELVGLHVTLMSDIDELVMFWNTELRRAYASSISAKDTPTKSPKNEGHSRWNTPVEFINLPFEMNDPNFDPAVELGTSPTSSIKQDARQPTSFLNVGSVMAAVQRARSSSYQNEDEKKNEVDNGTSRDMGHLRGKENVLLNSGLITPEEAIHSRSRFMTTAHIEGLQSDAYFEDWSDLLLSPRNDQFSVVNFDLNTMDLTPNAVMSPTSITNKSPFWRISSKVTELDDSLISAEAVALLPRRKFGQSLEEVTQEIGTQTPPQEQRAPVSSRNFGSLMSRIRAGTSDPIAAMTHGIVPMDNFVTSSINPRAVTSTPARFETDEAPAAPGTGEASDIYIEIGDQSDSSALRALASQPPPIFAMNTDITPSISDLGSQIVPKRSVSPRSSTPSAEPPRPPLTPIPSQSQDFYDFSLLDSVAAKKIKDDMETLCRSITRKTQPPPKQQLSVPSLSKAHYQLPATELPYIMLIDDEPSTLIAYFLASMPYRKKLNETMTVRPRTESSASGYNTAGNPSVFENRSPSAAGGENANAAEPNPMKPVMTKQKTGGGPPDARKASRLKNVHNIAKVNGVKAGGSALRDTSNDLMKPNSEVLDEKVTGRADRQGVLSKLDLSTNTPERTTQLRYTSVSPSPAPTTAYFKTASQQKKSQGKQPKHSIASQAPVRIPYTSIGGVDAPSVMNMINNRGQYSPNSGMLRVPADTSNGVGSVANMLGAEEPIEDSPSFSADGQDRKGSESPHIQLQVVDDTTVFGIRIVWARRFHRLRELCTEGEDKFIRSLSRCAVWEATGGKSGSTFLRTLDGRYVLKQMSRVEVASVIDLSEAYLKYMFESIRANRPTVLAKVLGIYQISMVDRKTSKTSKVAFIVMENVFYGRKIDVAFDLKGSQRSRYAETSDKNAVLLDENFVEFITDTPIYLRGHTKLVLETAVASDALFLCNNNVMDYSLLIGINYESKELVVGIIDYIRTYTLDKKMETWVKSSGILGGSGKMPTVISPNLYMKRFRTAVEDYFIRLPDKWTGKTIPLSYPDLYRDLKGPATEATNNTTLSPAVQTDSDTARAKTHSAGDEKEKARMI